MARKHSEREKGRARNGSGDEQLHTSCRKERFDSKVYGNAPRQSVAQARTVLRHRRHERHRIIPSQVPVWDESDEEQRALEGNGLTHQRCPQRRLTGWPAPGRVAQPTRSRSVRGHRWPIGCTTTTLGKNVLDHNYLWRRSTSKTLKGK